MFGSLVVLPCSVNHFFFKFGGISVVHNMKFMQDRHHGAVTGAAATDAHVPFGSAWGAVLPLLPIQFPADVLRKQQEA